METLQTFLIFTVIVLIGFILLLIALLCAERVMNRTFSIGSIFKNFGQKMWMTAGLGLLFFGFYTGFVVLGSLMIDSQVRLSIFFLIYKHPVISIYLGLLTFICISIGIYMARLMIKYLYNTRNKN